MTATMITLAHLPFVVSRLQKSLKCGFLFLMTSAGIKRAFRTRWDPILEILCFPLTEDPELYCLGLSPEKATYSRTFSKFLILGISVSNVIAVKNPTP